MRSTPHPLWTIAELAALALHALSVEPVPQTNGQVRDVPDRRTIRYYTTLGLLDRPAEMRGRTALYGRRHLLQLVAIKRLQAAGRSLAEIQQQLLGLPDAALDQVARLPAQLETLPSIPAESESADDAAAHRSAGPFWAAPPAPAPPAQLGPPEPLHGLRLSEDVTLLLAALRPLDADDIDALRTVAAPLLHILESRRLIRPRQERGTP